MEITTGVCANIQCQNLFMLQVVMPTVEADVAFGLGKFNLTPDEVKSRVSKALDAVSMSKFMQVT